MESLQYELEKIAEDIAEQSRWALDPLEIIDWFWEYYGDRVDNLVAIGEEVEEAYNARMQELIDEIYEELELYGWAHEEFERTYGMEMAEYERVEEIFEEEEGGAEESVHERSRGGSE